MGIVERVNDEMKEALKAKQAERLSALRNIRAGILYEMKKDGANTLADEACVAVLRKLEKQRQESIEAFSVKTWGVRFRSVCSIPGGWRIKAGSRFVKKDDFRIRGNGSRKRHAFLHPAR